MGKRTSDVHLHPLWQAWGANNRFYLQWVSKLRTVCVPTSPLLSLDKNTNEKQQKSFFSSVKIWSVDANGHSPLSSRVTDSYLLFIVSAL